MILAMINPLHKVRRIENQEIYVLDATLATHHLYQFHFHRCRYIMIKRPVQQHR